MAAAAIALQFGPAEYFSLMVCGLIAAVVLAHGSLVKAIVIADNTTPYRLFIEVLFTLGQNEFGKYHLMVMQTKKGQSPS